MIRSFAAAAALVLGAPFAFAADLPYEQPAGDYAAPAPAPTWSGAYAGAQAGYSWGKADNRVGRNSSPDGVVVGGYAGYNHQFDASPVVVGVETDVNYNDNSDRKNFANGRVRNELQWSGATRARVGYAFNNVMAYGAGGVAYGGQKISARYGASSGHDDKTAVGYTVGAGVETLVSDNVAARVEYRYSDYGSSRSNIGGVREKTSLTENKVMGGVAYKFSGF